MSLAFLSPDVAIAADGPLPARSPMEREARGAGARVELRHGWNVAVAYGPVEQERETLQRAAVWCDLSHLGKLELQGPAREVAALVAGVAGASLEPGRATRSLDAWWCPVTPERVIAISESSATAYVREQLTTAAAELPSAHVVDLTAAYGALAVAGPSAREVFARFTALDLRENALRLHGFRPGSLGRTPGMLVREADDRFLFWFGAALGSYMWTVVADAAGHLGGAPVGVDALGRAAGESEPVEEASTRA